MAKLPLVENFCLFFFQRFLQHFTDPNSREDENAGLDLNEPLYMQKLDEVRSAVLIRKAQGSEVVHVWSCEIHNIQFLCNNIEELFVFSDQCCWRAGVECELQSYSDF